MRRQRAAPLHAADGAYVHRADRGIDPAKLCGVTTFELG
jgi:hypothetical protein